MPSISARTLNYAAAVLIAAVLCPGSDAADAGATSPYLPSPAIKRIDWTPAGQIVRRARGSDNWPMTWGDDDLLYTAYGDGNGFEPFVKEKLSLGLARVRGVFPDFSGENIAAPGFEQMGDGKRGKKASGLLMVDAVLYLWARNAANSQLAWSSDHGATWTWADWKFSKSFGCPTFLNFGRNYAGARDGFVYVYSPDSDNAYDAADQMVLARVPKERIRERDAYEFLVRADANAAPIWTRKIEERGAVFRYPGHCYRSGITYDAGLRRYLWVQIQPQSRHPEGPRFQGGFGIYDAPEPWGPWTTVFHTNDWDVGPGETASFPTKWMSADGRQLALVFSGNDSFSVRTCTLTAGRDYRFDRTISREVLENYLSRAITMEGLLNGRGDLEDNIRMLKAIGAKFIGRSLCLWGGEANLLYNLERAKEQARQVEAADPDIILQSCIFEIVTTQADQVPVPEWAFAALGQPVEKRNFRYADMLYPDGRFKDHWRLGQSVPDVSRPETKLWFYFLGRSFIDAGCEAIHLGQTELMNRNDRALDNYAQVLALLRSYAAGHARRHMIIFDSHVPSGGLVRNGQLLMDFHSFPLRVMETPEKPQEAVLKLGFSDGLYGRSKGGMTFSGWSCEHLPYLVELDNWGVSRNPGQPKAGSIWIWGYDEITWFAHQSQEYRSNWLRYASSWLKQTDSNAHLEMPGSRTMSSPLDHKRWYYANKPSPAVPEGLDDEAAIQAIWAND